MTWQKSEDGTLHATAAGLRFRLIPTEEAIFGQTQVEQICLHLVRQKQVGLAPWTAGGKVDLTYRPKGMPKLPAILRTRGCTQGGHRP